MAKRLIELLQEDFRARRVPVEIMGRTVYASPLSVAESTKSSAMHPDDSALRLAETIVMKTTDAAGKPVFTLDDKRVLAREVAGDALQDLIAAIHGAPASVQAKN